MTFDEAIFCMKQYLPDSDSLECMKCPYYHTVPIEGTENGFTCKADEAHKKAIEALEQGDVLQNVKQEISTIPLTDGDGHNGHWFRAPQAIIKDVNVIIDKFINEVEQ